MRLGCKYRFVISKRIKRFVTHRKTKKDDSLGELCCRQAHRQIGKHRNVRGRQSRTMGQKIFQSHVTGQLIVCKAEVRAQDVHDRRFPGVPVGWHHVIVICPSLSTGVPNCFLLSLSVRVCPQECLTAFCSRYLSDSLHGKPNRFL